MNVEDNILLPYYIKERTVNEKTCQLMNEYLSKFPEIESKNWNYEKVKNQMKLNR